MAYNHFKEHLISRIPALQLWSYDCDPQPGYIKYLYFRDAKGTQSRVEIDYIREFLRKTSVEGAPSTYLRTQEGFISFPDLDQVIGLMDFARDRRPDPKKAEYLYNRSLVNAGGAPVYPATFPTSPTAPATSRHDRGFGRVAPETQQGAVAPA